MGKQLNKAEATGPASPTCSPSGNPIPDGLNNPKGPQGEDMGQGLLPTTSARLNRALAALLRRRRRGALAPLSGASPTSASLRDAKPDRRSEGRNRLALWADDAFRRFAKGDAAGACGFWGPRSGPHAARHLGLSFAFGEANGRGKLADRRSPTTPAVNFRYFSLVAFDRHRILSAGVQPAQSTRGLLSPSRHVRQATL